ncbi:hypothetical protein LINGRAPRIM_LOCUS2711 [Linum grandiflorum]
MEIKVMEIGKFKQYKQSWMK